MRLTPDEPAFLDEGGVLVQQLSTHIKDQNGITQIVDSKLNSLERQIGDCKN